MKKDGGILKNLLQKGPKAKDKMVTPAMDLMERMLDIEEALPNPEFDKSEEVDVEIVPDFELLYDDESNGNDSKCQNY